MPYSTHGDPKDVLLKIPAHARRWGQRADWEVTVPGTAAYGRDRTLPAAQRDAAAGLLALAAVDHHELAIVREADGATLFFAPHREGCKYVRVREVDGAPRVTCTTIAGGTPGENAEKILANHDGSVRVL